MIFDWMAPPQTYWTPPQVAQGGDKTTLALNGLKADGSKNTFGQILSYLPFSDVLNKANAGTARGLGLNDVAANIDAGGAESAQHSQIGMGLLTGAAGLLTGQPELVAGAGKQLIGGIAGSVASRPNYNTMGTVTQLNYP